MKRIALITGGVLAASVALAAPAYAHNPSAQLSCTFYSVDAINYSAGGTNHLSVTLDGNSVYNSDFVTEAHTSGTVPVTDVTTHHLVADFKAYNDPDGSKTWTRTITLSAESCPVTPPPTETTSPTPTPSETTTPPVSESPSPTKSPSPTTSVSVSPSKSPSSSVVVVPPVTRSSSSSSAVAPPATHRVVSPVAQSKPLAATGVDTSTLFAIALIVLALGGTALVLSRKNGLLRTH